MPEVLNNNGFPVTKKKYGEYYAGVMPDDAKNRKSMKQILATPLNSPNFASAIDEVMTNPEPLLQQDYKGYAIYDDILADPFVYGCYDSRMNNMLSQEFELIQGDSDKNHFEIVEKTLDKLLKQDLLLKILEARFISPSPIAVEWQDIEGLWLPAKIYSIPPDRIVYSPPKEGLERELRLLTIDEPMYGVPVHPHNYLVAADGADSYVNPYGYSLLSRAYWVTVIMKHTLKFWSILTEDHGQPLVDATYSEALIRAVQQNSPGTTTTTISNEIMTTLKLMRQNRLLVHPEGTEIKIHEGITGSHAEVYDSLILACKKMISILILGHEGGAISTAGQLGQQQTAVDIKDGIKKADTLFVTKYINTLIDWIYFWNFNEEEKPLFVSPESYDIEQMTKKAQLFSIVRNELGRDLSDEFLAGELNIEVEAMSKIEVSSTPLNNISNMNNYKFNNLEGILKFTNMTQDEESDLLDEFVQYLDEPDANEKLMNDLLKPMFQFINDTDTLEDMQKNYYKVYPNLNDTVWQERITNSNFLTYILGYYNSERTEAAINEEEKKTSNSSQFLLPNSQFPLINKEEPQITIGMLKFALELSPEDAVKYFRNKGIQLSFDWESTVEIIKKHAFTVTGVMKLDILQDFKTLIDKALSDGTSRSQFRKDIKDLIAKKGWLGKVPDGKTGLESPWRLNLIYHNNTRSALHDSRWEQILTTTDTIPYILSVARMNGTHPDSTKQCKALHNKVFKKTDKYYQKYLRCQRHHYCYSTEVSISEKRKNELGLPVIKGPAMAQYKNMKGFTHEGPWQPELNKYDELLVNQFKKGRRA